MSLSKNAVRFLDYVERIGGGAIKEAELRSAIDISHGSFIAARKELIDRNFILYTAQGGNRSATYVIVKQAAPDAVTSQKKQDQAAIVQEIEPMPRVIGEYASLDEWSDALMDALGDCLDIDDEGNGTYQVRSHAHDQTDAYEVRVNDDGSVEVA